MSASAPSMTLEFFSATDTGRARNNNEDSVAVDDPTALAPGSHSGCPCQGWRKAR